MGVSPMSSVELFLIPRGVADVFIEVFSDTAAVALQTAALPLVLGVDVHVWQSRSRNKGRACDAAGDADRGQGTVRPI